MILVSVVGIILVVSIITLYKTFAFYEEEKCFNILKGRVPEFSVSDITLAFTIDGEPTTEKFPNKEDGYIVKGVTCENNVTAEWSNSKWGLVNIVNPNNKKIKCSIDFKTATFADLMVACDKDAATCLLENASKNTEELAFDETADNNLRYIGANPNNYVNFNCKEIDGTRTCELWRIIGIMNNVPDSTGKTSTRIKLIKVEDLSGRVWDFVVNNWETSHVKSYLNSEYYNSLTSDAKSMISNITWNLGGHDTSAAIASIFYTAERGETTYNNQPSIGVGYIGLMYPSDYGFAVGGDARSTCLSTNLGTYNTNNCNANDWLYKSGKD